MKKERRNALRRIVAQHATKALAQLSPLDRAELLEGLSLVLPDKQEAEQAAFAAFAIRKAEDAQLSFGLNFP